MIDYRNMNIIQLNQYFNFTPENTPFIANQSYGFQINITHADIYPLYQQYHYKNNLPFHFPLSDKQRYDFEAKVFIMLEKIRQKNQLTPTDQSEIS